jgi:protein Tex
MNFEAWFAGADTGIPVHSANAVLKLVEEKATLPFIARYRKEQTGNLDEVAIQKVMDLKELWDSIIKRREFIIEEIERQGKLTDELKQKILATYTLELLEDIYLPYKQKRKTKATIAKEAGLEPLAEKIWLIGHGELSESLETVAQGFLNDEKGIKDTATALQGAQDILTERLAETAELRQFVREKVFERGCIKTTQTDKAKPHSKYERYFQYHESIQTLLQPQNSHRYLALRRGWMEEELSLSIGAAPQDTEYDDLLLYRFEQEACTERQSEAAELLLKAARLALRGYVMPSIDSEVHRALKEVADEAAIKVFAENVSKLLLAAPFGPRAVLGVDPGIRTGCKLAVVDDSGKFIKNDLIYLNSEANEQKSRDLLRQMVTEFHIKAIAVGNGTAGRETESFIREALSDLKIPVVMVNESGASVYSASEVAREEFPDMDLTIRGAISIARRLQDPLAELVKVDPKSIGVGQYQHDVSPHSLKKNLDLVVDVCVNSVGVNLNTASYHLLSRVSGIGPVLAKRIVEYRNTQGLFTSRAQLLEVPRFSQKTFEQAAGFLRIPGSKHPLDNTGVHPERYQTLEAFAERVGKTVSDLTGPGVELIIKSSDLKREIGDFTFDDIVKELSKPGRDPRDQFVAVSYREDIKEISDLKTGMVCPGIVTNVTNFGAFVDIGVHQDGLVHISQLSDSFVKDPRERVSPGDRVTVRVIDINLEKRQIALSMKSEAKEKKSTPKEQNRDTKAQSVSGFNNPFEKLGNWKK